MSAVFALAATEAATEAAAQTNQQFDLICSKQNSLAHSAVLRARKP